MVDLVFHLGRDGILLLPSSYVVDQFLLLSCDNQHHSHMTKNRKDSERYFTLDVLL